MRPYARQTDSHRQREKGVKNINNVCSGRTRKQFTSATEEQNKTTTQQKTNKKKWMFISAIEYHHYVTEIKLSNINK